MTSGSSELLRITGRDDAVQRGFLRIRREIRLHAKDARLLRTAKLLELILREVSAHPRLITVQRLERAGNLFADRRGVKRGILREVANGASLNRITQQVAAIREILSDTRVDTKDRVILLNHGGYFIKHRREVTSSLAGQFGHFELRW